MNRDLSAKNHSSVRQEGKNRFKAILEANDAVRNDPEIIGLAEKIDPRTVKKVINICLAVADTCLVVSAFAITAKDIIKARRATKRGERYNARLGISFPASHL